MKIRQYLTRNKSYIRDDSPPQELASGNWWANEIWHMRKRYFLARGVRWLVPQWLRKLLLTVKYDPGQTIRHTSYAIAEGPYNIREMELRTLGFRIEFYDMPEALNVDVRWLGIAVREGNYSAYNHTRASKFWYGAFGFWQPENWHNPDREQDPYGTAADHE